MDLQTVLIGGITAVTGALVYVSGLLWQRSEKCEKDRDELREEIEAVKEEFGESKGTMKAFQNCPAENCPFKPARPARYRDGEHVGEAPAA
jgi:hypothetical protein